MKSPRGYTLKVGKGDPYRLPDGRMVVDCTVILRPWYRALVMLRAGVPLVLQLPMHLWPRGFSLLAKACVAWPGTFTLPMR